MLGGKVLHDQRKMFIAYLSAALLIVLLITAVMYANTTTLVRRQHRESAQETARAQQRLLDRVFLELIMIAQQVEGDAELSDYYVSSAGYGAYQGMTSLRRYLVTNDYLLDVGLLFSDGHLLTAQAAIRWPAMPIALTCRRSSRYTIPGFLSADKRAIACMPPRRAGR